MLATFRRYSTANAELEAASTASAPTATIASMRPTVVIEPPARGMGDVPGIIPSGGSGRERMRAADPSGVEVFAGRGRDPAYPVPLLAQQELVEPDRATLEGHGRAREVEEPRAVDALAHDGARLVGAGLETLDPLAAGARVVQAQILQVEAFPLDAVGGPVGLGPRERHAVRRDAVVLSGPDGEAAPAAADVEERLARLELELAADEIDLVLLGLLELAVGIAVVGAGVEHERVEKEGVEGVRHVVVVRDGLSVPPL